MGLPSPWVRHLKPQDIKNFEASVRNSTVALGRLKDLLQEKKKQLDDSECSEAQYEFPSWRELQAHRNGRRSELKFILDLLTFLDP